MPTFKQLLCATVYGGHVYGHGSIMQLGYSLESKSYEYIVMCSRCEHTTMMDRKTLDKKFFEDENGTEPEQPK